MTKDATKALGDATKALGDATKALGYATKVLGDVFRGDVTRVATQAYPGMGLRGRGRRLPGGA